MRRVRPRAAASTTSTSSAGSGILSREGSFAFDEGPGDKPGSVTYDPKTGIESETISFTYEQAVQNVRDLELNTSGETSMDVSLVEPSEGEGEADREAPDEARDIEETQTAEAEAPMETEEEEDLGSKKTPQRITVTDDEVKAQLAVRLILTLMMTFLLDNTQTVFVPQTVEIDNPLSPKLKAYYEHLPKTLEDVPDYTDKMAEFKHLVLDLRPYVSLSLSSTRSVIVINQLCILSSLQANEYLEEANKKKLPTISITKPMTQNVAKREYNTIKKAIEDRDKFYGKQYDKRWAIAKKKAMNLKRSEVRKEAREKAAAEKKRLIDAAKAKAEQQKKEKAEAAKKARATARDDDDGDEQPEPEESSDEEVVTARPSTSRSGPAPSASSLPVAPPKSKRPYLPDSSVESRFGVILDEIKKIWQDMSGIKQDLERFERVSFLDKMMIDVIE